MLPFLPQLAGRFIVFEGADGSGKSTQFTRLTKALEDAKIPHTTVREPGGTPVGEKIRDALLTREIGHMSVRTEMLLYMASRAQLVEQRIAPALASGAMVLADRFVSSTLAYQGAAGGMDEGEILAVSEVATGNHWPDLTVVFDVSTEVAMRRLSPLLDRMEQKRAEFHARVRAGYLAQARRGPQRYLVVDSSVGPDEVSAALLAAVRGWCANPQRVHRVSAP